ncbi:MAG: hypothetical protein HYX69_15520 [Planctomycetia bacterium]|nr:hypothetical protein [Planctomycetia bacterium]
MIRAIIRKELRELLPFIALALLAQALLVLAALYPRSPFEETHVIPFVRQSMMQYTFGVAACLAVALGLWQTMWESSRGTFLFLLHRPIARERVIGTKLVVGAGATLLVVALPVLIYAVWAAAPGTHASPFAWAMTTWAWCWSGAMSVVYFGAFLSGLRPARLFGSRFAPLAAAAILFPLIVSTGRVLPVVLALVADGCFILAILHVGATRDYS